MGSAKLNILHISSHFYPKLDGTVRSIDNVVQGQCRTGHTVFLVTRKLPRTLATETYNGVTIIRVWPRGKSLLSRFLLALGQASVASRLMRARRFDVVHAHGFSSLMASIFIKIVYRVPAIVSFHGLGRLWAKKFGWRKGYQEFLTYAFERMFLRAADAILTWTKFDADMIARIYGDALSGKITVTPHPVVTQIFANKVSPTQSTPIILFVGTLSRIHGVEALVKAMPIVLREISSAKLVVIGGGPRMRAVGQLIKDLGVEGAAELVGVIQDPRELASYYQLCSLVVVPVQYRGGFPNVIVEALASGKPVVTTLDIGKELSHVGVFKAKSSIPEDLAAEIVKVLMMPSELRGQLGANARLYVEEKHSLQTHLDALERIYRMLPSKLVLTPPSLQGSES